MKPIVSLAECANASPQLVGGKAHTLGLLLQHGFVVPDGSCLTTEFFHQFLSESHLQVFLTQRLDEINQNRILTKKNLAEIRTGIIQTPFPPTTLQSIIDTIQPLLDQGPVAVRSSAPGEDGESESHAGVYHSEINLTQESDVLRAIKRCWASLFAERAFFYAKGAIHTDMAVLLQHSLQPDYSGVLFTQHPITGEKEILLEYTNGTNLSITDGTGGGKLHVLNSAASEFNPEITEGFHVLADRLRTLFQGEIDAEWALIGNTIVLLQARPITSGATQQQVAFRWVSQEDLDKMYLTPLGDLQGFFARQMQKKIWYRKFCLDKGIPIYRIFYLVYSDQDVEQALPLIEKDITLPFCRLDWQGGFQVYRTDQIAEGLLNCLREKRNSVGNEFLCIQVSDIVPARVTGYSTLLDNGDLLIEAMPNGIGGEKSGKHVPTEYVLDGNGVVKRSSIQTFTIIGDLSPTDGSWQSKQTAPYNLHLSEKERASIFRMTHLLKAFGEVRLEWYSYDETIFLKDLSIETHSMPAQTASDTALSAGNAVGQIIKVSGIERFDELAIENEISVVTHSLDDEDLWQQHDFVLLRQRLEQVQDAILVAPYPSIGLIPLIPFVKGMVFMKGSLLCHTAIVLREHQVPARLVADVMELVSDGDRVLITDQGMQLLKQGT